MALALFDVLTVYFVASNLFDAYLVHRSLPSSMLTKFTVFSAAYITMNHIYDYLGYMGLPRDFVVFYPWVYSHTSLAKFIRIFVLSLPGYYAITKPVYNLLIDQTMTNHSKYGKSMKYFYVSWWAVLQICAVYSIMTKDHYAVPSNSWMIRHSVVHLLQTTFLRYVYGFVQSTQTKKRE
mmetsp:Transcript_37636/g.60256  ORF Transcript_37636/g.60256 Transcript_37636/m.60256 type:complete len:179 (-) Transcript_37636:1007-1543(-)